jgi:hypothetical protein
VRGGGETFHGKLTSDGYEHFQAGVFMLQVDGFVIISCNYFLQNSVVVVAAAAAVERGEESAKVSSVL